MPWQLHGFIQYFVVGEYKFDDLPHSTQFPVHVFLTTTYRHINVRRRLVDIWAYSTLINTDWSFSLQVFNSLQVMVYEWPNELPFSLRKLRIADEKQWPLALISLPFNPHKLRGLGRNVLWSFKQYFWTKPQETLRDNTVKRFLLPIFFHSYFDHYLALLLL